MTGKSQIGMDFIAHLRDIYSIIPKDDNERIMNEIHGMIEFASDRRNSLMKILERLGKTINKMFEFKSVSIGIRCEDGYFRYVVFIGHPEESVAALKKLKYDLHQMIDYDKFPNIRIGLTTQYHPVESFPGDIEDELIAHHRPKLLSEPRKKVNEFMRGDYIDVFLHGNEGELLGWIELSETKDSRMPSRSSIRWIELMADACAPLIQNRMRTERNYVSLKDRQ
ncbi:MAG: hypothetical protein QW505_01885 [Thermoplasmata archaeon]